MASLSEMLSAVAKEGYSLQSSGKNWTGAETGVVLRELRRFIEQL